jgi:HJR/Mrr/RecB family endonuclease
MLSSLLGITLIAGCLYLFYRLVQLLRTNIELVLKILAACIIGGVILQVLLQPLIGGNELLVFLVIGTGSIIVIMVVIFNIFEEPNMLQRLKFSSVADNVSQPSNLPQVDLTSMDSMTGYEFEYCIAELLEKQGYITEIQGGAGDLGIDIIATKEDERLAIQCKRFSQKVSRRAVSDVVAGMHHYKCNQAMVVTNNYFHKGAIELAKSNNVQLVDRDILSRWISQA